MAKVTTLPGMVQELKRSGIVLGTLPDNVCLLVKLDSDEFENFIQEIYPGKGGMIKRATKIKGYIESEMLGIKVRIERI